MYLQDIALVAHDFFFCLHVIVQITMSGVAQSMDQ